MLGTPHARLQFDDRNSAIVLSDETIDRSPHDRAIVDLHRERDLVERTTRGEPRHHIRVFAEASSQRESAIEGPAKAGHHIRPG